jgi:hypothetical protein
MEEINTQIMLVVVIYLIGIVSLAFWLDKDSKE